MILKSFDFQCDFDFQINTSKMILILNHLCSWDLILKSSTYVDFAHLCMCGATLKALHLHKPSVRVGSMEVAGTLEKLYFYLLYF